MNLEENHMQDNIEGDNMSTRIENIIHAQNRSVRHFSSLQRKRLNELKQMQRNKEKGIPVNTDEIVKKLQRAGILDKNGDITSPYKIEDE